jgi:hypothetical protein
MTAMPLDGIATVNADATAPDDPVINEPRNPT